MLSGAYCNKPRSKSYGSLVGTFVGIQKGVRGWVNR